MTRDLEAEYLEFANKAANETDPKLKERWAGIAVGMRTVLNALASRPSAIVEEPLTPREEMAFAAAIEKLRAGSLSSDHEAAETINAVRLRYAAQPPTAALYTSPQPHTGRVGADLRTLVPGFRLDWSGLRNRFEEDMLRLEKLTTYESRAANLDEMARQFEDAVTAALNAALTVEPEAPTHQHVKRGSKYILIGIGKMQAEGWNETQDDGTHAGPSVDMAEVAIYRSTDDGSLWVRPREEFEDGRFIELPAGVAP